MAVLKNRAKMSTSTTGTGTITLGSALTGYQSFATAGVTNGDQVRYTIQEGADWELGLGTYTASGTTLSRTPSESSNGGSAIVLTGNAEVFITAAAGDILQPANNLSDLANAGTSRTNLGVAIGSDVQAYSSILQNTTASFLTADETKLDYISVTQAVDLDQMETDIAALANGMVYKGNWDASSGSFPGGGSAQTGWFYYVSVAGTVGGVSFAIGDNIVATTDNASTSTFAGNWSKHDQTDAVQAVVGLTGSIAKGSLLAALNVEDGADVTDAGNVNPLVDTHLNTSTATAGEFLSWDGSDYDWTAAGAPLYAGNESSPLGQPSATGTNAIAIGDSATASATRSLALGTFSTASGVNSVAIGYQSVASTSAIAVGNSYASGDNSFAASIDNNTASYGALGEDSVAMGKLSKAQNQYDVAIGFSALATGTGSIALGFSRATGNSSAALNTGNATSGGAVHESSVAIGYSATTTASKQIALGGTQAQVMISEAYTLPTSDGTAGTALVTDGSGALSFAAVGAELYAANPVSATDPTATGTNAVAIGSGTVASGSKSISVGTGSLASGSGAVALGVDSATLGSTSTYSIAIGKNSNATGVAGISIGYLTDATAGYSVAIGYSSQATGSSSIALGEAYASATDAFAANITTNTSVYGARGTSSIAMGYHANATTNKSIAIGAETNSTGFEGSVSIGWQNTATSGEAPSCLGGKSNNASGNFATVVGGRDSSAAGHYSFASGYQSKTARHGQKSHASGQFAAKGDAQGSQFILRADTTDATATVLTTDNTTPGTTDQIVAASDTCIMFSGTLVAMQNGAQDQGGWEIKGLLKNDGGTTTLVSSNIQTFADGNGWVVALTADNTNNALAITCTGEASHNIRWVANIHTSEVTYA